MEERDDYKGIFKTTFLFGIVQVINVLIKLVSNKIVAVLLGPSGIGIIGIYQSTINTLKTIGGMGVSQSAVKDISEIKDQNKEVRDSKISMFNRIIILASIFGMLLTLVLSPYLSFLVFNNYEHTYKFVGLSVAVFFAIYSESQLTILKGLRILKKLAKSSVLGVLLGSFFSVVIYICMKEKGVVLAIIALSFFAFIIPKIYVNKLQIKYQKKTIKEILIKNKQMIKMGLTLMLTTFLAFFVEFLTRTYILRSSTIENVGLFQVGSTILSGYFGIVITALITDYYPRIAAINTNDKLIENELNKQIKVGFLLLGPLVVFFILLMRFFLILLYSEKFIGAYDYITYAIFGVLITIASNPMDMILVAKSKAKLFLYISLSYRIVHITLFVIGFKYGGLLGLGIAFFILTLIHLGIMFMAIYSKYRIVLYKSTWLCILSVMALALCSTLTSSIDIDYLKSILGGVVFLLSLFFSLYMMKKEMNINLIHKIGKILNKNR